MNLVIDIGNTRTKIAFTNERNLSQISVYSSADFFSKMEEILIGQASFNYCIVSSVIESDSHIIDKLNLYCSNHIVLSHNTPLPIKNSYSSPETLGKDRIAAAVGAWSYFKNTPVLVIDSGTCLKADFIDAENTYCGGLISPGLEMRFKALHHFTGRLPLIQNNYEMPEIIGKDTKGSIQSGVINGMQMEIAGYINFYLKKHPDLKIVTTGGDIDFFALEPKNRIFARPDLILTGLNEILLFNANQ